MIKINQKNKASEKSVWGNGALVQSSYHEKHTYQIIEKLEMIYLNNPNQAHAICDKETVNPGTIRETFFACMLSEQHEITIPSSYPAIDDIEHGINVKIPLWLFGFLY